MTNPHLQYRPPVEEALEDATAHLKRTVSAVRAAASLDPAAAQDLGIVHAVLVDQLDAITALRRNASVSA